MIFIYNDYGGTHTTSLAAAYHLKKIPTDKVLTKEEIMSVDYFNKLTKHDLGKLIFHGLDEDGNAVYTIGRKDNKYVVPAIQNLIELLQEKYNFNEKIVISNTSPTVPIVMSIGGFFSRGLHIDFIGVPLLIAGAKQCCNQINRLVEQTKKASISRNSKIVVLENKSFN
ncbi:ABC transporter [Paenibacillus sp. 7884-2]|nr:ABC transporter [Paenibacillus sp. 7884-2]